MTILNVLFMTLAELFGNTHLKWFSSEGRHHNLVFGLLAYCLVIYFLIRTLSCSTMMWTCIMWESMILVGGAITAYFIFGEKPEHWIQWLGFLMALGAVLCINYKPT